MERAAPAPAAGFAAALSAGTIVLDGGLAAQLTAQGCDLSGALWTARLLAEAPAEIERAHEAFLRAGARVLTTAGYQGSFEGFATLGAGRAEAAALFARGTALARRAADRTAALRPPGERVWVAGSVGPYGAVAADGGEYRGRYGLGVAELTRFHRPRIEAVAAGGPDVLALETVPDALEAEALLRAAEGCGLPVWLSYTVADGLTRAGQPLTEAFAVAAGHPSVVAVGVNCCHPAEVAPALRTAAEVTGLPGVAYPNSGERWEADTGGWRGPVALAAGDARRWCAAGARLVGGCCRVGPGGVAALAAELATGGSPAEDR
ncbi:homocysteine S-methyltransferase [Streptomyces otsuchiensis]|uniref:homocysteine S-methyltransferase n=1 Tax=Streptomyces otsuchiensis TaxID=2681388 RepID=UPI00102FBE7B|nr:homocysteine S-methyltransferase [Streptomyces otsuchiensis]